MKSQLSTNLGLPLIDLADAPPRPGAHRHAIVDQVEGYYLGQPDTLLLEDGRTILVALSQRPRWPRHDSEALHRCRTLLE